MEAPECPICLQPYDGAAVTPRVLPCGHSSCEDCLSHLPLPFSLPSLLRCPSCTQLVPFPPPPLGASALPKNFDLLRLLPTLPPPQPPPLPPKPPLPRRFISPLCSDDIYSAWKDWIFPQASVSIHRETQTGTVLSAAFDSSVSPLIRRVRDDQEVNLLSIGGFDCNAASSELEYNYVAKVMFVLSGMSAAQRRDLNSVLMLSLRGRVRVCGVYGVWLDGESGCLYLVSERKDGALGEFMVGSVCAELCEILVGLGSEGLVCGCLGPSCLRVDGFGRVWLDLCEVAVLGRKVREELVESLSKIDVVVSPELLFELVRNEGVRADTSSDVWVLSCVIIRLLAGKEFVEDIFRIKDGELDYESKSFFVSWLERVGDRLEASVKQALVKCLDFDPLSRPHLTDVWRVMKERTDKSCLDEIGSLREPLRDKIVDPHFVLGEFWCAIDECKNEPEVDQLQGGCIEGAVCSSQTLEVTQDNDLAESLSVPNVISTNLQQHRDCVTGLTVGGGFLFSCSVDKTINVWSLQDFTHVHTFRGPEHRIMALIFVNEEQPICISGDIGGGIFIWGGSSPFGQEPIKKWYEQKDWRYNGIYALAAPGNGHLYTGGGDRLIKAWSLLDFSLLSTLEGHKSVVSSLAVCNSVLYSGSWDGTVRLWNLRDHCPLAVLGEDMLGAVASIHSLYADNHTIVATHEDGFVKVWLDDEFKRSIQVHDGAIFAVGMEGKLLFTGGWDKTVKIQEIRGEGAELDMRQVGSIACDSVITSLSSGNGELFVGCASGLIKVYHHDQ